MTKSADYIALESDFERQVKFDNKQFGVRSVYLPNPLFTEKPKFVLVAMEPSVKMKNFDPKVILANVEKGHKNFLASQEDFILHYCAYKFLCEEKFSYQITDIAKGAMRTEDARDTRRDRWSRWSPLLEKEIDLFKCNAIIAIGKSQTYPFLRRVIRSSSPRWIYHYSSRNRQIFEKYFNTYITDYSQDCYSSLRDFALKLLKKAEYPKSEINEKVDGLFPAEGLADLPVWKKGLLLHYQKEFQIFRNAMKSEKNGKN